MSNIKKAIGLITFISISILIGDVIVEVTGTALLSLNYAVANTSSYVNASNFTSLISIVSPIQNVVFLISCVVAVLELFGLDNIIPIGGIL